MRRRCNGAKLCTEDMDLHIRYVSGRRAFYAQRSRTVRNGGVHRSENVGMSSVYNTREKRVRRKSKVFWATLIVPELVGPKSRPKGVGDGQAVNILLLRVIYQRFISKLWCNPFVLSSDKTTGGLNMTFKSNDGVTRKGKSSVFRLYASKVLGGFSRQIRKTI